MKENLADIMCIGAQKASTSWLHHVIATHPRIKPFKESKYTSTDKEAHFWDWNYAHRGIDWYKDLMKVEQGGFSIDFTPEYALIDDKLVKECKEHSPSAKVIYILREPVCRAISALRMYILREEKDADFKLEYGDYFLKAIKESKIARHSEYFKNYWVWKNYYEDILVINYEDIRNNNAKVVDNVFKYLNLDMSEMNERMKKVLSQRMQKRVWKSKEFEISKDCIMFLDGMLHSKRSYFESAFEIEFEEHKKLLGNSN